MKTSDLQENDTFFLFFCHIIALNVVLLLARIVFFGRCYCLFYVCIWIVILHGYCFVMFGWDLVEMFFSQMLFLQLFFTIVDFPLRSSFLLFATTFINSEYFPPLFITLINNNGQWKNFHQFSRPLQIKDKHYIYKYIIKINKFVRWWNLNNIMTILNFYDSCFSKVI